MRGARLLAVRLGVQLAPEPGMNVDLDDFAHVIAVLRVALISTSSVTSSTYC
jgi:hypothetical protein